MQFHRWKRYFSHIHSFNLYLNLKKSLRATHLVTRCKNVINRNIEHNLWANKQKNRQEATWRNANKTENKCLKIIQNCSKWTKLIKLRRVKDTTTAQDTQLQTVTFKWWVVGGQSLQLTCRKNSMKFNCTIKNVGQTDEPGEEEWDWSVSVERHHNPGQTKSQTGVRLFKEWEQTHYYAPWRNIL